MFRKTLDATSAAAVGNRGSSYALSSVYIDVETEYVENHAYRHSVLLLTMYLAKEIRNYNCLKATTATIKNIKNAN